MGEFLRSEHRIRLWARTQGIPTPPRERWSLAAALDATDLFFVKEMGLDFTEDGVRIKTAQGWQSVLWGEQKEEPQRIDFSNPDALDFGPDSAAGRDFMAGMQAHNAAFGAPVFANAPETSENGSPD